MKYGFTPEGSEILEEFRTRDEKRIQEAVSMLEEARKEADEAVYTADMSEEQIQGVLETRDKAEAEVRGEETEFENIYCRPAAHPEESIQEQSLDIPNTPEQQFVSKHNAYESLSDLQPASDESATQADVSETQYTVTEHVTEQHVEDSAPGLLGEFTAGMTYNPNETTIKVEEVKKPEFDASYNRFTASDEKSAYDRFLEDRDQEYQKQQGDFEQDIQSSPLYRRSVYNRYG